MATDSEITQEIASETYARNLELAGAYQTYQELKIKEGFFDFGDLIFYLLELFRKRPSLLKDYQQRFKYVLVDEFQDTNIAQYSLIKLLCPPASSPFLSVVGDDSQAIYKFRGASVSNIMNFMHDYTNAKQVTLNKNYRSLQPVLDSAYRAIKHNDPDTLEAQLGISKELIASRGKGKDCVNLAVFDTGQDESEFVAAEVLRLKQKENRKFSDFALLVRANTHADPFLTALAREGIPYRFLGPGMLFKQPEIKDLIAYLKILANIEDSVSFYRVLTMDIFGIEQKDVHLLLAFAKKIARTLLQSTEIYMGFFEPTLYKPEIEIYKQYIPLLSEQTRTVLVMLLKMIYRHCELVKKDSAAQILYYFLEDSGYLKQMASIKTEKEEHKVLNITKFFNKLKTFELEQEDPSVFGAVEYIDMSMEMGESPQTDDFDLSSFDAVTILTVHGSKGLEFPVVFLTNLIKGRFPTYEKKEAIPIPQELIKELLPQGDYHLEEERRLFYVGMTRAMDKVYMTASNSYGEGKRERKVSPFIGEAVGEEEVMKHMNVKREEKNQLSIFDFKRPEEPILTDQFILKNFSFSQLESYKNCGLQYKYQYLLKIPAPAGSAAAFGDTVHKTLQKFYEEYMQNKSLGLDEMLTMYEKLWVPIGYTSASHQERMKKEGKEMLARFYEKFHPPQSSIGSLEKLFKIRIDNDVFVTGKIDRVDVKENGSIEIIDYKTGKKPNEKELQKSLQLSIYALAATDRGLYNKPVEQVTLTFYYLQDMDKISMQRTAGDLLQVKQDILSMVTDLRTNKFLPKVGPHCNFCPFRMICEAWQ